MAHSDSFSPTVYRREKLELEKWNWHLTQLTSCAEIQGHVYISGHIHFALSIMCSEKEIIMPHAIRILNELLCLPPYQGEAAFLTIGKYFKEMSNRYNIL